LLPGSRKAAGNPSVECTWPHRAHDSPCGRRAAEGNQALQATGFGGGGRDFQAPRVIHPQTRPGDTNTSPHRFGEVMTTGQFPVGRNCRERKASRTTQIWCSPTRITKAPIVAKAPGRPGDALLAIGGQNPIPANRPCCGRPWCVSATPVCAG